MIVIYRGLGATLLTATPHCCAAEKLEEIELNG
jgi:hypothetical protein